MEETVSGIEDMIEEIDTLVKESVNLKSLGTKHPRNVGHYEKTESMSNKNRGMRKNSGPLHRKCF